MLLNFRYLTFLIVTSISQKINPSYSNKVYIPMMIQVVRSWWIAFWDAFNILNPSLVTIFCQNIGQNIENKVIKVETVLIDYRDITDLIKDKTL